MKQRRLQFEQPLLFGHRGCSALAPENTFPAFDLCRRQGIPGIEFDVQLCATGEPVIFHDYSLKRITGFEGNAADTPLAKIRELDAGSHFGDSFTGEKIPLLDELFATFGKSFIYDIEVKSPETRDTGLAGKVWEHICRHSLNDRCIVSSFNPFQIRHFRKLCRDTVPTAVIYSAHADVPPLLKHGAGRHIAGCGLLKPHHSLLTDRIIRRDIRRGYQLITWTVDDPKEAERLVKAGIRGVIANNPQILLPLFGLKQAEEQVIP